MATTFLIPLTTLPAGSQQFGPAHPADSESSVTLTVDRTVAGGLNSLTSASTLGVTVDESLDAGVTWQNLGGWTTPGGTILVKGTPAASSFGTWQLVAGPSRQMRATVTVTGPSAIAVAGSIVTQ